MHADDIGARCHRTGGGSRDLIGRVNVRNLPVDEMPNTVLVVKLEFDRLLA
jgi:hypothetical protein